MPLFFYYKDVKMDIAKRVNYETTFEYEVTDPETGEGTGLFLDLRSTSSAEVKAVSRKHIDFISAQQRANKTVKVDVLERQVVEKLVAAVAGWRWEGDAKFNGEKLEYTPENVRKVVEVDWIFDQVNKQVGDIENFTKS